MSDIRELPKEVGLTDISIAGPVREHADRVNRMLKIVGDGRIKLGDEFEIVWDATTVTIRERA